MGRSVVQRRTRVSVGDAVRLAAACHFEIRHFELFHKVTGAVLGRAVLSFPFVLTSSCFQYHSFVCINTMGRDQILSAAAIEQSIDEGHLIVVHEGYALKLDGWLNKHPGGKLAILHMVGRDATDEINV